MTTYRFQVRYNETGAEGFVYHANYYTWLDLAQEQFLKENGLSYQEILRSGIHFAPIDIRSKYYAPAYFGDLLKIEMWVRSLSNVKAVLEYKISREADGALVMTSLATYACLGENFRPAVLKKMLPGYYQALERALERA